MKKKAILYFLAFIGGVVVVLFAMDFRIKETTLFVDLKTGEWVFVNKWFGVETKRTVRETELSKQLKRMGVKGENPKLGYVKEWVQLILDKYHTDGGGGEYFKAMQLACHFLETLKDDDERKRVVVLRYYQCMKNEDWEGLMKQVEKDWRGYEDNRRLWAPATRPAGEER